MSISLKNIRKPSIAAAVAASVAALAAARDANAGCWGCYPYGNFAPGLTGGPVVSGAAPYGAYYDYGPSYSYPPAPAYNGPSAGCYWRKQRVWDWDGQYVVVRRVQVCY